MGGKQKGGVSAFETLSRHEVPKEFQEEYVNLGFRPVDRPLTYYMCTLFTKHNELLNVWTHLLPFLFMLRCFVLVLRQQQQSPNRDDVGGFKGQVGNMRTFYLFMCTVLAYLLVSSCAHLMHSASKSMHYLAFYCDFVTIAFYSFLSAVTFFVYSSTPEFFSAHRTVYIPVAWILALSISYACCYAKFKFTRPYPFVKKLYVCGTVGSLYLWNIYPILDRIAQNELRGNTYHVIHIITFVSSVFFYSSGWPQKSFPGRCDLLFHGHQIFHVLIAVTTWFQVQAVKLDMESYWKPGVSSPGGVYRSDCWDQVSVLFLLHFAFSLLVIRYFFKKINSVLSLANKDH